MGDFSVYGRWALLALLGYVGNIVRTRSRWGRKRSYDREYARLRGNGVPHERAAELSRSLAGL